MNNRRSALRGLALAGATTLALGALATPASAAVSTLALNQQPAPAAAPAQQRQSPIDERYDNDAALRDLLGAPVGDEVVDGGVHYREYERGRLYWTEATGAHEAHGDILARYLELGGHEAFGVPETDEVIVPDGVGHFNHFTGTDATGKASIYWTWKLGANMVHGPVHEKWADSGWETGPYAYPTNNTSEARDGGLYNHFTERDANGASIYWSDNTDAHDVLGRIREHWSELNWEYSYLGYPVSDEYDVPEGKRSDFQFGYIVWNSEADETHDFPY